MASQSASPEAMAVELIGHAPVAVGTDKELRSYLKELDVPLSCIVGATIATLSDDKDSSGDASYVHLVAPSLHYTLPKSVHTLALPEDDSLLSTLNDVVGGKERDQSSRGRKANGGGAGVAQLLNSHVAVVKLPAGEPRSARKTSSNGAGSGGGSGGAATSPRTKRLANANKDGNQRENDAGPRPVVEAFLRDIPALQSFLARFLTDAYFSATAESTTSQATSPRSIISPPSQHHSSSLIVGSVGKPPNRSGSTSSSSQHNSRSNHHHHASPTHHHHTISDYLRKHPYVLDLDPGGQGIRLHVPQVLTDATSDPFSPSLGSSGISREATSSIEKEVASAVDLLVSHSTGQKEQEKPLAYDTYLVRPSFNRGSHLMCVVSYVDNTEEKADRQQQQRRGTTKRREVLPLSCTPMDIVKLIEQPPMVDFERSTRQSFTLQRILCLCLRPPYVEGEKEISHHKDHSRHSHDERSVREKTKVFSSIKSIQASQASVADTTRSSEVHQGEDAAQQPEPSTSTTPSVDASIAPMLVVRQRMLESTVFCKALWRAVRGVGYDDAASRRLYCTILPGEMRLLRLVGCGSSQLDATCIAEELQGLSKGTPRPQQLPWTVGLGYVPGLGLDSVKPMCKTLWEAAHSDPANERLLTTARYLFKLVPILLEVCLHRDGLNHAVQLCRLALGHQGDEKGMIRCLRKLSEKHTLAQEEGAVQKDGTAVVSLLELVLEFEELIPDKPESEGEEGEGEDNHEHGDNEDEIAFVRSDSFQDTIGSRKSLTDDDKAKSGKEQQQKQRTTPTPSFRLSLRLRPDGRRSSQHGSSSELTDPALLTGQRSSNRTASGHGGGGGVQQQSAEASLTQRADAVITKAKNTFPPRRVPRSSRQVHPAGVSELALDGSTSASANQGPPSSDQSGREIKSQGSVSEISSANTRTVASSRSSISDETEIIGADPPSHDAPSSFRTKVLARVPKLSITKPDSQEDATAPQSAAASGRAGGGNSSALISPFTTRSSRRYNASRSSRSIIPQQRNSSSSIAGASAAPAGAFPRSSSISSSRTLMDTLKLSMLRNINASFAGTLDRYTAETEDPATDTAQTKLTSLARKVGQSYLASDLWAIIESQRRAVVNNIDVSDSFKPSTPSNTKRPALPFLPKASSDDDVCHSIVLEPMAAFWVPQDSSALLYWDQGLKALTDIVHSPSFSASPSFKVSPSLRRSSLRSSSYMKLFPSSSRSSQILPNSPLLSQANLGVKSEGLKLLRDMLKLAPPGSLRNGLEGLDSAANLIVDELLLEVRQTYSHFASNVDRCVLLEAISEALNDHANRRSLNSKVIRGGDNDPMAGSGSNAEPDPVIRCIERRLLELQELYEKVTTQQTLENQAQATAFGSKEVDPVTGATFAIVRGRTVVIQRCVAAERLATARALLFYIQGFNLQHEQGGTKPRASSRWGMVVSMLSLVTKVLSSLRICDPSTRPNVSIQIPFALGLEEAGFVCWLLKSVDVLIERCSRLPNLGLRLLEELQASSVYIETVKECLQAVVFQLQASQAIDKKLLKAVNRAPNENIAFCTPAALARIRLAIISHVNRCLDLCRSTLAYYRRDQELFGKSTDDQRGRLRSIIILFHRLNLFVSVDSQQLSRMITMNHLRAGPGRSTATKDQRTPIALLWVLGKVVIMDTEKQWADTVILYHFTSFLKFYAGVTEDPEKKLLCKLHLRILLSLASSRSAPIMAKCFQLKILPFFVHEISAEMQQRSGGPGGSSQQFVNHDPAKNIGPLTNDRETLQTPPLIKPHLILRPKGDAAAVSSTTPAANTNAPPNALKKDEVSSSRETQPTTPLNLNETQQSADILFNVDDNVSGLVTLKSGKQRWFPAKVVKVEGNDCYTLAYDDGDVQSGKPASEIRISKARPMSSSKLVSASLIVTQVPPVTTAAAPLPTTYKKLSAIQQQNSAAGSFKDLRVTIPAPPSLTKKPTPNPEDVDGRSPNPVATPSGLSIEEGEQLKAFKKAGLPSGLLREDVDEEVGFSALRGPVPTATNPTKSSASGPAASVASRPMAAAADDLGLTSPVEGDDNILLDDDEEDDDDSTGDSGVFSIIPVTLAKSNQQANRSATRLQMPEGGLARSRLGGGQMANSLSASLFLGDRDEGPSGTVAAPSSLLFNFSASSMGSASSRSDGSGPVVELGENSHFTYDGGLGLGRNQTQDTNASSQSIAGAAYQAQRANVALYSDIQLQELVVMLLMNLCISSDRATLDQRYCMPFPSTSSDGGVASNALFALYCHLNHPDNAALIPALQCHVPQFGRAISRLFRLLCDGVFDTQLYPLSSAQTIASGAFGTVLSIRSPVALSIAKPAPAGATSAQGGEKDLSSHLSVKLIRHEITAHDRCVTYDVFSEISALELLSHSQHVCHLYDYGVSDGKFWLVMERCKSSLKAWRLDHMPLIPSNQDALFYLDVFARVLDAVQTLHDHSIAHFDIKCDNIFIRDVDVGSNARSAAASFTVCIGDFGEAQMGIATRSMAAADDEVEEEEESSIRKGVVQARGTEAIQSPEMLQIVAKTRQDGAGYDRRKRVSVGCASDVWSLGCLLYELLTGQFLFNNFDWSEFFVHLTSSAFPLPPPDRMEPLRSQLSPEVFDMIERLLEYMLVRDAERRPRVDHVRRQLQLGLQAVNRRLPQGITASLPQWKETATNSASSHKEDGEKDASLAHQKGLEQLWLSSSPSLSSSPKSSLVEGLWRLSNDAYIGSVVDWRSFFRCPLNLNNVMAESEGAPSNPNVRSQPSGNSIQELVFSAAYLPDIWGERQWLERQHVPASQLGINRLVFILDAGSKSRDSLTGSREEVLTCSERDLSEVENILLRGSGGKTPPGLSPSSSFPTAPSPIASSRKSLPNTHNASFSSQSPKAAAIRDGITSGRNHEGSGASVLNLQIGATTVDELVKGLEGQSAGMFERAVEYCLSRSSSNGSSSNSSTTNAASRGVAGAFTIVIGGGGGNGEGVDSNLVESPANSLASALATVCMLRSSADASFTCLYEAILKVKATYPRAFYNANMVQFLHYHYQGHGGIGHTTSRGP